MKDVKVLGPGCKRCVTTAEMIQTEADKLGVPVTVEKVTDYAGGLPKPDDLARWLAA